jgi:hypothetical protein
MTVFLFILPLLFLIVYLLFGKLTLEINTVEDRYFVDMPFVRLRLLQLSPTLEMDLKIVWWKRRMTMDGSPGGMNRDKKKKEKKMKRSNRISMSKILGVIRSFRITRCHINLDTGNMPLNGILYPWFFLVGKSTGHPISINFTNQNIFVIRIENTIARMLWAYIKS